MKDRSLFRGVAAVCLLAAAAGANGEKRPPARVYTEEDLARVSSRRGETGVESQPAVAPPPETTSNAAREAGGRGESYWRAEAARVRQRVDPWRDDADDLRAEIAARQAEPG